MFERDEPVVVDAGYVAPFRLGTFHVWRPAQATSLGDRRLHIQLQDPKALASSGYSMELGTDSCVVSSADWVKSQSYTRAGLDRLAPLDAPPTLEEAAQWGILLTQVKGRVLYSHVGSTLGGIRTVTHHPGGGRDLRIVFEYLNRP